MPYSTRPATSSDLEPMMRLAQEGLRPHFERLWAWNQSELDAGFRQHFVLSEISIILVDGQEAGYFKVEDRGDHNYLDGIFIGASYRRHGIGREVVADLLADARACDKALRLRVISSNPAQELYKRLGFKVTAFDESHVYMEAGGRV